MMQRSEYDEMLSAARALTAEADELTTLIRNSDSLEIENHLLSEIVRLASNLYIVAALVPDPSVTFREVSPPTSSPLCPHADSMGCRCKVTALIKRITRYRSDITLL